MATINKYLEKRTKKNDKVTYTPFVDIDGVKYAIYNNVGVPEDPENEEVDTQRSLQQYVEESESNRRKPVSFKTQQKATNKLENFLSKFLVAQEKVEGEEVDSTQII